MKAFGWTWEEYTNTPVVVVERCLLVANVVYEVGEAMRENG